AAVAMADGGVSGLHPSLGEDGIHDPANPGLQFLQQPDAALRDLPQDRAGNFVNWVEALDGGYIAPRKGVKGDAIMNVINMDVLKTKTSSMPQVKFPHRQHTAWLGCNNCHPAIFLPQKDGNPITMYAILKGEFCGVCHGKVAFPVADCFHCHNTPVDSRRLNK
ncbi:MAG: hypothetical protein K2X44_04885, partial [Magnetospirillum sp.]|nr:hypothetical protein [Magnetospirillum sp.]